MPETRSKKAFQVQTKIKTEIEEAVVKSEDKLKTIKTEVKQEIAVKVEVETRPKVETKPMRSDPQKEFDEVGKPFWKLGRDRRVYVSEFKGKQYVHIRSFYEDRSTGEDLISFI